MPRESLKPMVILGRKIKTTEGPNWPGESSKSRPSRRLCLHTQTASLPSLQSFPASGSFPVSQLFASGDLSIRASAFSISPSNEYSGLISFRFNWFDLLAVQGTLKSLLQLHSSKASILWCSALPCGIFTHGPHSGSTVS